MNKKYIIIGVLVIFQFLTLDLVAQCCSEKEKTDYTIEEIKLRNPWIVSNNVSRLAYYQFENFASTGIFYNSENGTYRNYNTPKSVYNMGVTAQAYKKMGKLFFYGDFTYSHDINKDQAWLGTYKPNFTSNPIFDSIPGKVLVESYDMSGKIAYALTDRTALGIGFDYHTATMAKRKDGRNSNTFSSITVKPSLSHKVGDFTGGINLSYKHDVDRVNYEYIGDITGKKIYYMEGLFFMSHSGIASSSTVLERAYFLNLIGGGLQLDYSKNNFEWFNEFKMDYGKLNNYEDIQLLKRYSQEELLNYHYGTAIKLLGEKTNHFIKFNLNSDELGSSYIINSYEPVPDESRAWAFYEKGKVLRYMTSTKEIDAFYRFCYKKTDWKYNFNLLAGYNRILKEKTYKVFPETYTQDYTINTIYFEGKKFFYPKLNNTLEFEAGVAFSKGSDDDKSLNSKHDGDLGKLQLNRRLLDMDYHYHNVSRTHYNIGARYRHILSAEKNYALEFCLKYQHTRTEDKFNRSFLSFSTNYIF